LRAVTIKVTAADCRRHETYAWSIEEPMTTPDTATLLEDATDRIADFSRSDLQIMLRRAALLLRSSGSIAIGQYREPLIKHFRRGLFFDAGRGD
jgi:hypothetical protein